MNVVEKLESNSELTYKEVISINDELKWQSLANITVGQAIDSWLMSLRNELTRINYKSGLKRLIQFGILNPEHTLQQLVLVSNNSLLDRIRQVEEWSEASVMARSALLLSFFRFLCRRTDGIIKRLEPSKEGESQTFYKIRDTVVTEAMTQSQWSRWLVELAKMNKRDCLIAKVILQGAKRVSEVLNLEKDAIDFEKSEITFKQSKSRTNRQTIITYPKPLMDELSEYIGNRTGVVFITSSGKKVTRTHLANTFGRSGEKAGLPIRVTPHVLRASAITYLKSQGYSDSQIRKVSGHASCVHVNAYDKCTKANNVSKFVNLV